MQPDELHRALADAATTLTVDATPPGDLAERAHRRLRRRVRILTVSVAVVVLGAAALLAVLHDSRSDDARVAGPGGTDVPAPGSVVPRLALGQDDILRGVVTGRDEPGVWAFTTRTGGDGDTVTVWHYDATTGEARRWAAGRVTLGPDAYAVCADRVWYSAGGDYGGAVTLTSLDPVTGATETFPAPAPEGELPPGSPIGVEGPGSIPGIACDDADGSIVFTRSAFPAYWRLDPATGLSSQHWLPDGHTASALANDGSGNVGIGLWRWRADDLTMTDAMILGPGSDEVDRIPLDGASRLVGTRSGFLAVSDRGVRLVPVRSGSAGDQAGTFTAASRIEPWAGAGMLPDGRVVFSNGADLVFMDPKDPAAAATLPLGLDRCRPPDPRNSTELPPGCVTSAALVAVDDAGNVYVNDPRTNVIEQVGPPDRSG